MRVGGEEGPKERKERVGGERGQRGERSKRREGQRRARGGDYAVSRLLEED